MKKIELNADELNMIQTLRSAQALTGNTTATDGAKSFPKKHKTSDFYHEMTAARHMFGSQLNKDGKIKKQCLEAVIANSKRYADKERFTAEFHQERERLVDSARFCRDCKAKGLVPEYVAEHTVFLGKTKVSEVLQNGIQVLGDSVMMYNCPLLEDKFNLYTPAAEAKEAAHV